MNKNVYIIFFILSIVFSLFADDYSALFDSISSSETTTDTSNKADNGKNDFSNFSPIPDFKLSLYGDHKFEFRMPVIPDYFNFEGDIKAPKFLNELGIEINYKDLKFKSAGKFDILLNDFGSWDKVLNLRPLENYISWSPWKVKLSAGLQYFSWGTADKLNPTDNINPRDYTVGANYEKIPILSAAFSMYPVDFFSFDVVYVPFEQNDIFPVNYEDEIPEALFYGKKMDKTSAVKYLKTNLMAILSGIITQDDIKSEFEKYTSDVNNGKNVNITELGFKPENFTIGGKTNFRFPKVDFSFSYLYDFDQYYTPQLALINDEIKGSDATADTSLPLPYPPYIGNSTTTKFYRVSELKFVRNRIHRFGADIKATVDRFGIWGEVCFNMTEDYLMESYKLRNHKVSYSTGFDFSYGPNDDFYFNFQYFGDVNLGYDDKFYKDYKDGKPDSSKINDEKYMEEFYYRAMVNQLGGETEGFMQGVSLKMKWPVLDSLLTPSIAASYMLPLIYDYDREIRYGSMYLNPEFDIMPIDSFHITIGADLYFSWYDDKTDNDPVKLTTTDKIGRYHKDSSVYLAIKYKWGMDFTK